MLPLAMFLGTFAWSFVYVSLPFHIQRISTWDAAATRRWTGWILGISPLATVATAPLWGRLAGRGNPRTYYVLVQVLQGHGGEAIGVINAARIGASFVGPVVATSLLAAGSPPVLYVYVLLAVAGLACVPLSAMRAHVPAMPR